MRVPVFTSSAWSPAPVEALAIFCSDGRWREAFDDFCRRGLRLRRYDRYSIPGGPACIALKGSQAAREHLTFLVRAHEIERIVVVTHQGCAFYGRLLGMDPEDCLPQQEEDLRAAAEILAGWFPGIRVEAYVAKRSGSSVGFYRLETG
jgi:hypothetical protein